MRCEQCKTCSTRSSSVEWVHHTVLTQRLLMTFQFFDDNLQDENTVLAFRMLVKDLLVLFQAGNEGVCNILGQ